MGSSNAISPGGGSKGKRIIVTIRVKKIRLMATIASNASEGCCIILTIKKSDISQRVENMKIDRSLAGIISNKGSESCHPCRDSMKAKK